MENKTITPRKAFTVLIHDKEYDAYNIEGKEHEGYNDTSKTRWLYYSDRLPEGLIPPADSENFVPWSVSIQRLVWDIRFKQKTTSKYKWNNIQFRNNTWCEMHCNGKLIYEFGTIGGSGGMSFAMSKAEYMQTMLLEHCFNFLNPQEEQGRKICWHGMPATISVSSSGWEIGIVPDYTDIDKEEWWKEYASRINRHSKPDEDDCFEQMDKEDFNEAKSRDYINWGDAFSDEHIYWFRK